VETWDMIYDSNTGASFKIGDIVCFYTDYLNVREIGEITDWSAGSAIVKTITGALRCRRADELKKLSPEEEFLWRLEK
jgi:hypothetical protein